MRFARIFQAHAHFIKAQWLKFKIHMGLGVWKAHAPIGIWVYTIQNPLKIQTML